MCGLAAVLTLTFLVPDPAFLVSKKVYAEGETVYESVIQALVASNLSDAARYSDLTDDIIKNTFKSLNTSGGNWSEVKIQAFLNALGEQIKDVYTQNVDDGAGNITVVTTQVNPWSTQSASSPGSPYSPGKDFLDNAMTPEYTMGNLIASYARNSITVAGLLTDEKIIEVYDRLAGTGADSDPFIKIKDLSDSLIGEVNSANIGGYADQSTYEYIDLTNAVTYGLYVRDRATKGQGPVPAGTLFIGTWLVDAQSMNETFYRAALASMSTYNQQLMLYKSELAGNSWRDIYGATGLEAILPLADNVEEGSLADYLVTVVVGSDGMPKNAKTGEAVDLFNLTDPYNLEEIPELRSLKIQYDAQIVSATDTGSKLYVYDRLTKFFESDGYLTRQDYYADDCKYILNVSTRSGIAFYAADYRYGPFYGLIAHLLTFRLEESGRGFLESLETAAENSTGRLNYDWGASDNRLRLIRGNISWKDEVAWKNEIDAAGGIEVLRNRIYSFQEVWRHFSTVRDEVTDEYDRKLAGMGTIYADLRANGTSDDKELADMALLLQEKLDAGRRARVYYNLVENEEHNYFVGPVLNLLYQQVAYGETPIGRNYKLIMYTDEDFAEVGSITEAVENAITECNKSYIKYDALSLSAGSTIVSQTEYELSNYIIENASGGTAAVSASLRDLVDLGNISNNVIAHKTRELTLTNKLLDTANLKFSEEVHSSAGDTYNKAASDPNTTQKTLDEILSDQKADVSAAAVELQSFIKAKAMRLKTDDAIEFVKQRINWAEAQREGISGDAFGPYAEEALNAHIKWLSDLLKTVKEGGEIMDEVDELEAKKAKLEQEMLTAYDNSDNETGDALKKQIEDLEKQIDEANQRKADIANDPNASAADKIEAQESGTQNAVADKIADDLLYKIGENNLDGLEDGINALVALNSPRLPEILEALKTHGASTALINKVQDAIDELDKKNSEGEGTDSDGGNGKTGAETGEGGGGSGGNGNEGGNGPGGTGGPGSEGLPKKDYGAGTGLEEDDFDEAIKDSYPDEPYDFGLGEQAAAVSALINFADARNDKAAYDYAMELLDELIAQGNPFIYRQYVSDLGEEYVSLAAVDKCRRYTGFRFVDDTEVGANPDSSQTASMQQYIIGSASYKFTIGDDEVAKNNGATVGINKDVALQSDSSIRNKSEEEYPYITEKASGTLLHCTCVYIPGTEWAILITPATDRRIALILDALDKAADTDNENN